jgi:hypothetical protein
VKQYFIVDEVAGEHGDRDLLREERRKNRILVRLGVIRQTRCPVVMGSPMMRNAVWLTI